MRGLNFGKLMLRIDRNKSMWQSNPHWRVPDQDAFGLGSWDSDVLFHRVLVREIGGQGHEREETQRRVADRAITVLGDVPVERAIPGEETLSQRDRTRGCADLGEEVARQRQRAEHHHARKHPRDHRNPQVASDERVHTFGEQIRP